MLPSSCRSHSSLCQRCLSSSLSRMFHCTTAEVSSRSLHQRSPSLHPPRGALHHDFLQESFNLSLWTAPSLHVVQWSPPLCYLTLAGGFFCAAWLFLESFIVPTQRRPSPAFFRGLFIVCFFWFLHQPGFLECVAVQPWRSPSVPRFFGSCSLFGFFGGLHHIAPFGAFNLMAFFLISTMSDVKWRT